MHFPPTWAPYETVTNLLGDSSSGNKACHLSQANLGKLLIGQVICEQPLTHSAKGNNLYIQFLTSFPHLLRRKEKKGRNMSPPLSGSFIYFILAKIGNFPALITTPTKKIEELAGALFSLSVQKFWKPNPISPNFTSLKNIQHSSTPALHPPLLQFRTIKTQQVEHDLIGCNPSSMSGCLCTSSSDLCSVTIRDANLFNNSSFGSITCTANPKFQG